MANSDSLKNKYDADVDFAKGESPTATKLDNWDALIEESIDYLCDAVGDVKFDNKVYNPLFITNLARAMGELDQIEPARLAGGEPYEYEVTIAANTREIELPLPIYNPGGVYNMWETIRSCSQSTAINTAMSNRGFVTDVSNLALDGQWTFALDANGDWTNKIVLFNTIKTGETIVYRVGASGDLSGEGSFLNVLPSRDQLQEGNVTYTGLKITDVGSYYTLALPFRAVFDESGTLDTNMSGERLSIPSWYGNIVTAPGDPFPNGLIMLWDETLQQFVSVNSGESWPTFSYTGSYTSVRCSDDVTLDLVSTHRYSLVIAGQSIAKAVYQLKEEVKDQDHGRVGKLVSHGQIMGTFPPEDAAPAITKYGPSNLPYSFHPHNLHRAGYSADTKNTNNAMHGDIRFSMPTNGLLLPVPVSSYEHTGEADDESYGVNFGDGTAGIVGRNVSGDWRIGLENHVDGENLHGIGRSVGANFLPTAIVSHRDHAEDDLGSEFRVYETLEKALDNGELEIYLEPSTTSPPTPYAVTGDVVIPAGTKIIGGGITSILEGCTTGGSTNMFRLQGNTLFQNLVIAAEDNLPDGGDVIKTINEKNDFINCWFVGDWGSVLPAGSSFIYFQNTGSSTGARSYISHCHFTSTAITGSTASGLPDRCIEDAFTKANINNNSFSGCNIGYYKGTAGFSFLLDNYFNQSASATAAIVSGDVGDLVVRGNTFNSDTDTGETISLVDGSGGDITDVLIQSNSFTAANEVPIKIQSYPSLSPGDADRIIIKDNIFQGSKEATIFVNNAINVDIKDNIIENFSTDGTWHTDTVAGIAVTSAQENVSISGNKVYTASGGTAPNGAGIYVTGKVSTSPKVTISGNNVNASTEYDSINSPAEEKYSGIYVDLSSCNVPQEQINVVGNNLAWGLDSGTAAAIYIIGEDGEGQVNLGSNVIVTADEVHGIFANYVKKATVVGNNIHTNDAAARGLWLSSNITTGTVSGNNVRAYSYGIQASQSEVTGNIVEIQSSTPGAGTYGIYADNAVGNTVTGNSSTNGVGIRSDNSLSSNVISSYSVAAMVGREAVGNNISGGYLSVSADLTNINGNQITSDTNCILVSSASPDRILINNNTFYQTAGSGAAILFENNTSSDIESFSLVGNNFYLPADRSYVVYHNTTDRSIDNSTISNNVISFSATMTNISFVFSYSGFNRCSLSGNTMSGAVSGSAVLFEEGSSAEVSTDNTLLGNVCLATSGGGTGYLTKGWGTVAEMTTDDNLPAAGAYADFNRVDDETPDA